MSTTGLRIFDDTLHKTHTWLNELMELLGWQDKQKAYLALRATLHTLRDRMLPDEVLHLGAQLPMLIRGLYYEGWKPREERLKERTLQEFLNHISVHFELTDRNLDFEKIAHAVFIVLNRHIDHGEINQIRTMMPEEVRAIWPAVEHEPAH